MRPVEAAARELIAHNDALLKLLQKGGNADDQDRHAEAQQVALKKLRVSLSEIHPKVICLCGSTRFIDIFAVMTWEIETKLGHIVLGCTMLPEWYCQERSHFAEKQGLKGQRDNHHLRKIDMADEVLILNLDGYIGESTKAELVYARNAGKKIWWLEDFKDRPKGESVFGPILGIEYPWTKLPGDIKP